MHPYKEISFNKELLYNLTSTYCFESIGVLAATKRPLYLDTNAIDKSKRAGQKSQKQYYLIYKVWIKLSKSLKCVRI